MRTKKVFKIGVLVIILICFFNPLTYIIIGKKTPARVVGIHRPFKASGNRSRYTYPVVEFYTWDEKITFYGEQNLNYNVGDSLTAIYYPFNPVKAKIFSLAGLFAKSIIQTIICLLIWFAFISSFKTIFDKPIRIRKKNSAIRKSISEYGELSPALRVAFKIILILFILFISGIIITVVAYFSFGEIHIRSLLIVVTLLVILIVFIIKELQKLRLKKEN